MKTPPSRLKRTVRELQLVASAGAAVCILYALVTSTLLLALTDALPAPSGRVPTALLTALLSHGTLLALVPGVTFAMCWVLDARPGRIAFGSALVTELFLVALRFDVSGMEGESFGPELLAELGVTLLAGWLGLLAGRAAVRKVAARAAAEAAAAPAPTDDLAESLRKAQSAPPAAPAPPAEAPKGDPS